MDDKLVIERFDAEVFMLSLRDDLEILDRPEWAGIPALYLKSLIRDFASLCGFGLDDDDLA